MAKPILTPSSAFLNPGGKNGLGHSYPPVAYFNLLPFIITQGVKMT